MKTYLNLKIIISIMLGSLLYVLGINLFLEPLNLYTTGLMGFSQIINTFISTTIEPINITSLIYFMLNLPIIIFGYFKVGKKFIIKTFLTVLIVSIFQKIIPNDILLINDELLSVICSGVVSGMGLGILLQNGTSTGGTDIIALYFSLVKGKSFGKFNVMINVIIVVLATLISQDLKVAVLIIILLYIFGLTTDKIHNANEKSLMIIITSKPKVITEMIVNDVKKGVTVIDSRGGISNQANNTLIVSVWTSQLPLIINHINAIDQKAFINVVGVEKVIGYFPSEYKKIL